jgi:hypothetical protein
MAPTGGPSASVIRTLRPLLIWARSSDGLVPSRLVLSPAGGPEHHSSVSLAWLAQQPGQARRIDRNFRRAPTCSDSALGIKPDLPSPLSAPRQPLGAWDRSLEFDVRSRGIIVVGKFAAAGHHPPSVGLAGANAPRFTPPLVATQEALAPSTDASSGLASTSPSRSRSSVHNIDLLWVGCLGPPCRASSVRAQAAGRGAGHVAAVVISPLSAFPAGSI